MKGRRPPIPGKQAHRDRKNDYRRQPKHPVQLRCTCDMHDASRRLDPTCPTHGVSTA